MNRWGSAVCQMAVETWDKQSQLVICMEEMAELTKELSKNLRGSDNDLAIAEEVADVEIMLEQIKLIFDIRRDVDQITNKKLLRLGKRIDTAQITNKWMTELEQRMKERDDEGGE